MPRDDVMGLMKTHKFVGMPKVYDEVLAAGRKRRHTTETVIEELLQVEVSERRARSIPYSAKIQFWLSGRFTIVEI